MNLLINGNENQFKHQENIVNLFKRGFLRVTGNSNV